MGVLFLQVFYMFRLFMLLAALLLSACHSIFQEGHQDSVYRPITKEQIAGFYPSESSLLQQWDYYLFDIQIVHGNSRDIPQFNEDFYKHVKIHDARFVRSAGSFGHSSSRYMTQTSTGIWIDPRMNKTRARIFIDMDWPLDKGTLPVDLAGVAHISARLSCEPWAQGVVAAQAGDKAAEIMQKATQNNMQNHMLAASFISAPYKIDDFWIVPVAVELPHLGFYANCIDRSRIRPKDY